jgi:hypothetical protein
MIPPHAAERARRRDPSVPTLVAPARRPSVRLRVQLCAAGPIPLRGTRGRLVNRPAEKTARLAAAPIIVAGVYDRGISVDGRTPKRGRLKARQKRAGSERGGE